MIKLTVPIKITLKQNLQLASASLTSVIGGPLSTSPCRDAGNVRTYPEKDSKLLTCEQLGKYLQVVLQRIQVSLPPYPCGSDSVSLL